MENITQKMASVNVKKGKTYLLDTKQVFYWKTDIPK